MRALIVVPSRTVAVSHINPVTTNHRTTPDIRFWWPSLGHERLLGLRCDLVAWVGFTAPEDAEFILAHCCYATTLQLRALDFTDALVQRR